MKIPHAQLDANENPYGPSPKAILAVASAIRDVSRYPRGSKALEGEIASSLGVEPDGVIAAAGGDRAIELAMRCLSRSAKRLLIPVPSFQMYESLSRALELAPSFYAVPTTGHDGLVEEVREGDLVVLGSPNNPDGKVVERGILEALLKTCSWLIIDEAYTEYDRTSFAGLTTKYPNLLVIRTFSKAFGLAGLRIGYLVASVDATKLIRPLTGPYEVSSIAIEACMACLDDPLYYDRIIELTCENRSELLKALGEIEGIRAMPSHGNFILLRLLRGDASEAWAALKRRNVFVRNCLDWRGLEEGYLRVSVGTRSELDLFVSSLGEVLGA